jgi:hypothetical protein
MKLVSTLKMVSLNEDPSYFEDGELYFNTDSSTVKLSYSGSWFNLIDSESLEYEFSRNVTSITGNTASYSYLILSSEQNSILLADSASVVNFIVPRNITEQIDVGSSIKVVRSNIGKVQFTPESGVTLNIADSNYMTARWTSAELIKIGSDEWILDTYFPDIY